MTTEISLEQQTPPTPDTDPEQPERGKFHIPKNLRFRRLRAWLRFLRIKIAKAILLPELAYGEGQALRRSVSEEGELTNGYMLMCALSAGIATLGLLQSSTAVVIGAMLISPLMSPIAALGFAFASIDGKRIREAARVVAVGAAIGILTGVLLTWASPIRNATPEILARTQPTLLDLAVALFSGIAGGYATVIRKGGTAIGVAIATALMPPLAVLGYGLGVLQVRFALGALLLFLTNLAAITFSFALIARLSGAARPLYKVEWKPRHAVILAIAFIVLAVPLTMTLVRLSQEASMRSAATTAIMEACGGSGTDIAQLEVAWPLFDEPTVDALVIAPTYTPNAEQVAEEELAALLGEEVEITLQQVQATNFTAQTEAMVNAAMERTAAGIASDVPPFDKIRGIIGLPTRAIWTNTAQRMVYVEPVPAPEWTLADYYEVERLANEEHEKWSVRIVPPPAARLTVALAITEDLPDDAIASRLAVWALQRWGMSKVSVEAPDTPVAAAVVKSLNEAGIEVTRRSLDENEEQGNADDGERIVASIGVYSPSPSEAAAASAARQAAAKAKSEADALEKQGASGEAGAAR